LTVSRFDSIVGLYDLIFQTQSIKAQGKPKGSVLRFCLWKNKYFVCCHILRPFALQRITIGHIGDVGSRLVGAKQREKFKILRQILTRSFADVLISAVKW
jgi:hypothetical protein